MLVYQYAGTMTEISPKKKVTFYLSEDVLRAAKVQAARTDKRDSELVEEALRSYLGWDVLERLWAKNDMDEDEAMDLAVTEVRAVRKQRAARRR
jgi:hypothetical protein